nr:MAG TPA: hypothetical protein [Bacteriophage sp.]
MQLLMLVAMYGLVIQQLKINQFIMIILNIIQLVKF